MERGNLQSVVHLQLRFEGQSATTCRAQYQKKTLFLFVIIVMHNEKVITKSSQDRKKITCPRRCSGSTGVSVFLCSPRSLPFGAVRWLRKLDCRKLILHLNL